MKASMQAESLKKQEESIQRQEAIRRGKGVVSSIFW